MDAAPSDPRLTSLLDNQTLSVLETMRLNPMRRFTNRSVGEHLSGKGGTSTEFSDYRDYVPGDDVRNVDWNIFARLNRPYLKLFQHEEVKHVVIILDASSSMRFEGKFQRAKQLAAAFGVMTLLNVERLSVYACQNSGKPPLLLPSCTGRMNMKRLFDFLEPIEAEGDFPLEKAVEAVLQRHRGRGIAVLISDFLTLGDLERPFNFLFGAGLEIFGLQILSPSEINPELAGDLRLVDCELGYTLDVSSAGNLMGLYEEHRTALEQRLALWCRQRSGRFLSLSSDDPLDWVLFDVLRRRGWAR